MFQSFLSSTKRLFWELPLRWPLNPPSLTVNLNICLLLVVQIVMHYLDDKDILLYFVLLITETVPFAFCLSIWWVSICLYLVVEIVMHYLDDRDILFALFCLVDYSGSSFCIFCVWICCWLVLHIVERYQVIPRVF